jgi:hypothetical protein
MAGGNGGTVQGRSAYFDHSGKVLVKLGKGFENGEGTWDRAD